MIKQLQASEAMTSEGLAQGGGPSVSAAPAGADSDPKKVLPASALL